MAKVYQEFYCGNCSKGTYIRVKLNMSLNHVVEIECPRCKHLHKRAIKNGVIFEDGRENGMTVEQICPPLSACSDEPVSQIMIDAKLKGNYAAKRNGQVIETDAVMVGASMLAESWFEKFAGKV